MPIWRKEHELARVIVHYIGIVGVVISGTALCGQLSHNIALYQWGHTGAMSLPTATICCLFGIGFFLVSRGEAPNAGDSP